MNRRRALQHLGCGFGLLGLAKTLEGATSNPLTIKAPHFAPKAKHVIFLYLNGGVSQVDTFDPKPELAKHAWKVEPVARRRRIASAVELRARPEKERRRKTRRRALLSSRDEPHGFWCETPKCGDG